MYVTSFTTASLGVSLTFRWPVPVGAFAASAPEGTVCGPGCPAVTADGAAIARYARVRHGLHLLPPDDAPERGHPVRISRSTVINHIARQV